MPAASTTTTQSSATSRIASLRAFALRASGLRFLAGAHFVLERGGALRGLPHFRDAAQARHDQEQVFEDDPRGVFEPAPLAGDEHAVDRLRPEHAAQHVIERDDDGGRNQHPPVAIEREERERAEDVEVRLDAAAGQVDQQRAHQHLRDGDDVARRQLAGAEPAEQRRENADDAAEDDRGPHVRVRAALRAFPGQRRDPQRERDAEQPLKPHQPGEQPIGPAMDVVLILGEQLVGAALRSDPVRVSS